MSAAKPKPEEEKISPLQPLADYYQIDIEQFKQIASTPYEKIKVIEPTQEDIKISKDLESYFMKSFITPEQLKIKQQVLQQLEEIIQIWSDQISKEKNIVEEAWPSYRARLLPFGSYCLGVSSQSGDIDLVVVAPDHFNRDQHFNKILYELFKSYKQVTKCKFVDAKNPIITFYFDEQAIDISFSKLDLESIPEAVKEHIPDHYLTSIQEKDINAINGRRNNVQCLESVGKDSLETYKQTLKALKIWQKAAGLTPNKLGYFGGIDMAILSAKVCQLFPKAPLNKILVEFFRIYSHWDWEIPVKIKPYNEEMKLDIVKNFDGSKDQHCMQIITPAFPTVNTIKASYFNLQVIKKIFLYTHNLLQNDILTGKKEWTDLFQPFKFFDIYKKYIQIDILGSESPELYEKWKEFCEVKMLKLFQKFDEKGEFFFHPFPRSFDKKENNTNFEFSSSYFIGIKKLRKNPNGQNSKNVLYLRNAIKDSFVKPLYYEIQKKYNNGQIFDARIFYSTINELEDVDLGQYLPKELENTKRYVKEVNNNNSLNQKRRGSTSIQQEEPEIAKSSCLSDQEAQEIADEFI